jgi:hypothetical protein
MATAEHSSAHSLSAGVFTGCGGATKTPLPAIFDALKTIRPLEPIRASEKSANTAPGMPGTESPDRTTTFGTPACSATTAP